MSPAKPPLSRLSELAPGQQADFFARHFEDQIALFQARSRSRRIGRNIRDRELPLGIGAEHDTQVTRLLAGGRRQRGNGKQTPDEMFHPPAYSPGTMRWAVVVPACSSVPAVRAVS